MPSKNLPLAGTPEEVFSRLELAVDMMRKHGFGDVADVLYYGSIVPGADGCFQFQCVCSKFKTGFERAKLLQVQRIRVLKDHVCGVRSRPGTSVDTHTQALKRMCFCICHVNIS